MLIINSILTLIGLIIALVLFLIFIGIIIAAIVFAGYVVEKVQDKEGIYHKIVDKLEEL